MVLLLYRLVPLCLSSLIVIVNSAEFQNSTPHIQNEVIVNKLTPLTSKNENKSLMIEEGNMLLVPVLKKYTPIPRKKNFKKSARTIQKIIKKKTKKAKAIYVSTFSTVTTTQVPKEESTTPVSAKKKNRKNRKMPYLPTDVYQRIRRAAGRDDFYILEDFDEAEFLSNESGNNAVLAHVKKYW